MHIMECTVYEWFIIVYSLLLTKRESYYLTALLVVRTIRVRILTVFMKHCFKQIMNKSNPIYV